MQQQVGEHVWFNNKRAMITNYHARTNVYTVLVYDEDTGWQYIETTETLQPRRHIQEANIFFPLDKVWVKKNAKQSIGVITSVEKDSYIAYVYDSNIWLRMNVSQDEIEHRFESDTFNDVLFDNRKSLLPRFDWRDDG